MSIWILIKAKAECVIICRYIVGLDESKEKAVERYKCVLVCCYCCSKVPYVKWLKQQKFIFSPFCRLEGPEQGSTRLISGGSIFWLADGPLLTISSHGLSFQGEQEQAREQAREDVLLVSLLYGLILRDQSPILMTQVNLELLS